MIVAFEKSETVRRHTFELPGSYPNEPMASVDAARNGDEVTLTVSNRLPHNLPTGDFGMRIIVVRAQGLDAKRRTTPVGQWELTRSGGGALSVGGSRRWTFSVPPAARRLRVTMVRYGLDDAGRAPMFETEILLP